MMSDQEQDTICTSMPHLSTAAATPYKTTSESPEKYAMAFSSSGKRQSPSSLQEPAPKRANFNSDHHHLPSGFTKLALPQSFPTAAPPPLRRTVSEPINFEALPPQFSPAPLLNRPPQERNFAQESLPFPNPPPVSNGQVVAAATATPPRPPRPRSFSQSPRCGESPTNKRLKRMKERMREMNQWWNQVVQEVEDDDGQSEDNHSCHPKEETEGDMENPAQEAVWVEKNGDCLVLHFRCPCGNGYQVLLNGNNCYYKLTTF